jgi:hypothetical protein
MLAIILTAMRDDERTKALAELRQPRPCRVCGLVFTPKRWDKLLCSTTCQQRYHRGGDLAYLIHLPEAARGEARRRHAYIEALIKEVQAHTAAERERRYKRRGYLATGQMLAAAETLALAHFRKNPNIDRDDLIDVVVEELDLPPVFAASTVNSIMSVRQVVLERLRRSAATRDQLIAAVRDAFWYWSEESAAVIVDDVLALPSAATIIAGPGVSTMVGGGTPKTGVASTMTAGSAVPFRPLSPEVTAVLEKIFQAWRIEVVKAFDDLPKADRGNHTTIVTALSKALPHIPPEAIAQIMKEL